MDGWQHTQLHVSASQAVSLLAVAATATGIHLLHTSRDTTSGASPPYYLLLVCLMVVSTVHSLFAASGFPIFLGFNFMDMPEGGHASVDGWPRTQMRLSLSLSVSPFVCVCVRVVCVGSLSCATGRTAVGESVRHLISYALLDVIIFAALTGSPSQQKAPPSSPLTHSCVCVSCVSSVQRPHLPSPMWARCQWCRQARATRKT